ncbi:hypothetical protein H0N99_04295 [Candidatus Micrarchaeota archaeon]|nr:hypothetical protein [Candidatus Micrarchaeota archaeon]
MKREYSYISDSFFKQEYTLSQAQEYAEMILYAAVAFSLPFILGHEQLLVGSVVNCALVLAALNLRGARLLPVILLPSVGALLAGMVFGPLSVSLVYMLPFIWLGNAILVFAVKELVFSERKNRLAALTAGSLAKTALLSASAFALFFLGLVPAQFIAAFGIIQLATALCGGAAALGVQEVKRMLAAA